VFGIDENGALRVAWVVAAGAWNPPFPISHAGMFRPGAGIAASNQFGVSHQTDVFIVDESGALNVAWVVNAGAWHGPIAISRPNRRAVAAQLFDIGGNAPTATATGWRQLDDR
jgi:hypothetical protein